MKMLLTGIAMSVNVHVPQGGRGNRQSLCVVCVCVYMCVCMLCVCACVCVCVYAKLMNSDRTPQHGCRI